MKRLLTLIFLCFFLTDAFSQQLEIGANLGYWFNNIVDSKSDQKRVVIGNAFWKPNTGLSAIYFLKKPGAELTYRIGLLYRNSSRGSISEKNSSDYFESKANTFGAFTGAARDVGKGYIFYIDVGFSYSTLNTIGFYKGAVPQTTAFPDLSQDLNIKSNEASFIYAIGVEKEIVQNKLKVLIELNGDAGISKINTGTGSYRTQSLGFGTGLRYILGSW